MTKAERGLMIRSRFAQISTMPPSPKPRLKRQRPVQPKFRTYYSYGVASAATRVCWIAKPTSKKTPFCREKNTGNAAALHRIAMQYPAYLSIT